MKHLIFAFLFTFLFSLSAQAAVDTGMTAPEFMAIDSKGEIHRLSDFKGKTVVLEWTNHGCPFVRKHYDSGNMQNLQEEATDNGIVWLSIVSSAPGKQGYVHFDNADDVEENPHYTAKLLDPSGKIGRMYGAKTTPHMYVIDSNGILVYQGAIDSISSPRQEDIKKADNYVQMALADLKAGRDVQTSETRAYGCAVKY